MELDIDSLTVETFSTTAAVASSIEPKEPGTINTGPGGQYTLCYICTTYPVD